MGPIHLFDVISQRNWWLSVRQSTIAGNIANANTPGFKALDVEPFKAVLEKTALEMTRTQSRHISSPAGGPPVAEVEPAEAWEVSHSGNTVSLEHELIKAGEVSRGHRLNASIVKAFHRMLLASVKG
jgi:flagellar basal-body rod protein FlgB